MIPMTHILVLSQPIFVERQVKGALRPSPAPRRSGWRRLFPRG